MYDFNEERSEDFDRRQTRCDVSVAGLGKRYNLTIEEAEHVRVWIDDWYDDPGYYFDFFNTPKDATGMTGFEKWLEEHRKPRVECICDMGLLKANYGQHQHDCPFASDMDRGVTNSRSAGVMA